MDKQHASQLIKDFTRNLGFRACGIAKCTVLDDHRIRLADWLENGFQGSMNYMSNNFETRLDPGKLVDNARSVIVVLQSYNPPDPLPANSDYLISRYAYGNDYHDIIRDKLRKLQQFINHHIAECRARVFTDSAPILERAWAVRAGLGWMGKNSMLIYPKEGSYFFIGELITDLELEYDAPFLKNHCGNCRRCIDACPTKAIVGNGIIDSRRCISYLTIEHQDEIPVEFLGKYPQWIFGCDICQQVCPWNQAAPCHDEHSFFLPDEVRQMRPADWEALTKENFKRLFANSPIRRTTFERLKRNIEFIKKAKNETGKFSFPEHQPEGGSFSDCG